MPSASSKNDRQASTEVVDPLRQAITIVEHKIRNLEKRKGKLDSYKESGKPLTKEQVEAVSKYEEVAQQLELSKEYVKQFTSIINDTDKLKKKQARKEVQERMLADINKIKQVLIIQDVLHNMGSEAVRDDFLSGKNGAAKLAEDDLKALDDLYLIVEPKHGQEDGSPPYVEQLQRAAEHFLPIVEGKPKEVCGTTFAKLKHVIMSIHSCGYFDQQVVEETTETAVEGGEVAETDTPEEEEEFHETQEILSNVIVPSLQQPIPPEGLVTGGPHQPPSASLGPPIQNSSNLQQLPSNLIPTQNDQTGANLLNANVANIVPTPVSQVESSFFNAQGFKPPVPPANIQHVQNQRQLSEVISNVTSNFNFLQDSELETSELLTNNTPNQQPAVPGQNAGPIPTRTFTNQAFNNQPPPNNFQGYPTMFTQPVELTQQIPGFAVPGSNAPNPIPMPHTRNQINSNFNQTTQPIVTNFSPQNCEQVSTAYQQNPPVQPVLEPNIEENKKNESENKSKCEEWAPETGHWNDVSDWAEASEWNSQTNQTEGFKNQDKFNNRSNSNRSGSGGNTGRMGTFAGNRSRSNYQNNRQGYQGNQGSNNFYQNQNGYRNDRNSDYNKGQEHRDRGDHNRGDNGGFKKGLGGRNSRPTGDRGGDRQPSGGPRNNSGGPRPPRSTNRVSGNGPNFTRAPPSGKQ